MNFFIQAHELLDFLEQECSVVWTHLEESLNQAHEEKSSTRGGHAIFQVLSMPVARESLSWQS